MICNEGYLPLSSSTVTITKSHDLDDLKDVLQYLSDEGKEAVEDEYGRISTAWGYHPPTGGT